MRITNLVESLYRFTNRLNHPRWSYLVGLFALGAGINIVDEYTTVGATAIILGSAHLYRAFRNDINRLNRRSQNSAYQNGS